MPANEQLEARYRARSLWLDGYPGSLAPRDPLPGDIDCDAVIVGAGMTGLWTAYYLKSLQPDMRVVVVEREIAGYGPSGRNGGWVSAGVAGSARAYGLPENGEKMLRANAVTEEAVDEIGRVVDAENIECGFSKQGSIMVATSEPQRARLAEFGERHVIDAAEAARHINIPGTLGASYSPAGARIDPARLVRGLADACERLGVTIYEHTAALELGRGHVRCAGGTVRADVVIGATESYTTQFAPERMRYLPLYSLMIATEPLPDSLFDELNWRDGLLVGDVHYLFFYAQRTMDNRIAIGGRGAPYELKRPISEENERSEAVKERLLKAMRRAFPPAADAAITHHWGGPLAVPRDWSMSVAFDRSRGYGRAGGYTGHGVAATNVSGRTLADLVLQRDTELVTMPWVGHRSRRWEPEPLRFLASRAMVRLLHDADLAEDATGKPSRRRLLVAPFMPPH